MTNENDKRKEGSVWLGISIGFFIYLIMFIIVSQFPGMYRFIFLAPLVHICAIIFAFIRKYKFTGIGLLIFAGIALLLIAACYGLILSFR
ncbi:hypothetical protein [Heyndrickxia acidicola]|uniref:Uncharacterized protein n=1 Tax=Heyndrickxia acidicola TaxID=209389 RepID=A0ABU6MF29_9BACI|nr:hypothetical protein [Heyndrickxia acidicola]MED1201645.1 hypothetical protein [Heyndrickxia acidicola]